MPAVTSLFFFATATILPTPSARSPGVIAAVSSDHRDGPAGPLPSLASAIGRKSGSGSCTRAMLSADCTARFNPSSSKRLVVARAVLPPNATRIDAASFTSATFWWMVLFAKRVSEKSVEEKITSISSTVENFLIFSKICSAWDWVSILAPAVGNWQLAIGKISFGPPVGAYFSGQCDQHSLHLKKLFVGREVI